MRIDRAKARRRKIGLTPLIDVVFLLLIFFMLATRFGVERSLALEVAGPATETAASDPLSLRVEADGQLRFQGEAIVLAELASRLGAPGARSRTLAIEPAPATTLQRIVSVLVEIQNSGHETTALLAPR